MKMSIPLFFLKWGTYRYHNGLCFATQGINIHHRKTDNPCTILTWGSRPSPTNHPHATWKHNSAGICEPEYATKGNEIHQHELLVHERLTGSKAVQIPLARRKSQHCRLQNKTFVRGRASWTTTKVLDTAQGSQHVSRKTGGRHLPRIRSTKRVCCNAGILLVIF